MRQNIHHTEINSRHKSCILMRSEGASYYKNVKVKVSHSLIAIGAVGVGVPQ